MRILLVCEKARGTDGWGRYSLGLHNALKARGHEIIICCNEEIEGLNCRPVLNKPLKYTTNPFTSLVSSFKFSRAVSEINPDAIHITVEPYAMMVLFLRKHIVSKTVLTIHGSYGVRIIQSRLTRMNAKRAFKLIPKFITVSNYTKQAVSRELGKDSAHFNSNVRVIRNGIELPEWNGKKEKSSVKQILLVGGVKPRKGVIEAIEACAVFKKQFKTPFSFTIAGRFKEDSAYVEKIRNRISELNLNEEIKLLGKVGESELASLYQKADLFLMPALTTPDTFEGFGLVYLEANAFGVPCIGPNASGAAEAIEEGMSGFHCDPNNAGEIASRMNDILNRNMVSPAGCREWAEKHDIETVAEEVEKVYASIV